MRERPALAGQLGRFMTVGVANTILSYGVYLVLVHLDVPVAAAGASAFAAGAVQGYLLNGRWTFSGRDSGAQRLRYLLVQIGGVATTSAVVWLATTAGVPRPGAYLVAIAPITLATFALNRRWVFERSRAAQASAT